MAPFLGFSGGAGVSVLPFLSFPFYCASTEDETPIINNSVKKPVKIFFIIKLFDLS